MQVLRMRDGRDSGTILRMYGLQGDEVLNGRA
jgi:hypothetical protein